MLPSIDQVSDQKQSASVIGAFCPVLERTGTIPGALGLKWSNCHSAGASSRGSGHGDMAGLLSKDDSVNNHEVTDEEVS